MRAALSRGCLGARGSALSSGSFLGPENPRRLKGRPGETQPSALSGRERMRLFDDLCVYDRASGVDPRVGHALDFLGIEPVCRCHHLVSVPTGRLRYRAAWPAGPRPSAVCRRRRADRPTLLGVGAPRIRRAVRVRAPPDELRVSRSRGTACRGIALQPSNAQVSSPAHTRAGGGRNARSRGC
jgi:hypothetical protein